MTRLFGKNAGFTLIELMVTLVVAAVLLTIGIPSFQQQMAKNRLKGAAETFHSELQFARLESIEQNTNVTVQFSALAGAAGTGTLADPWSDWCFGLDEDPSTACDCNASPANCTINGIQRIVNGTDHPGISVGQNFSANNTMFDPVRGIVAVGDVGRAEFNSPNGEVVQVRLAVLGRARICSDDLWDYENC